ncbi:short-chain fatty acyl-CoA regulator family protein [Sphingomonadaceae bacterium jetA1]|jgi:predicted transcriptional regulator/DNA-binding XRE family transcriptional regulator|uniref:helix-turn-helix domain-containing protein n=1 Tax=Facivitalis istanbulensis TaxID=3075838 RepID=UPI003480C723
MSGHVARSHFAGHRVRELRRRLGISQAAMAAELRLSISYLSQIESGDRPLTASVLAAIAEHYPSDWNGIDPDEGAKLLMGLIEASTDTSMPQTIDDRRELEKLVRQQPLVAQRLLSVYRAHRRTLEQLRILDETVESNARGVRLPWEEVRDWFQVHENYVDGIDRRAEVLASELGSGDPRERIERRLFDSFGVRVDTCSLEGSTDGHVLRDYDAVRRILRLDNGQAAETTLFSLAYQLGRLEFAEQISEIAFEGQATSDGRSLLSAGLANYAAGAILMPYAAFRDEARASRHDVDRLRRSFGTSFEQTCHRLSTLQRPGAAGAPVFFCRVDMAGNITKRHSATSLQFARYGGACPLWIVHEAVAVPDRILVQLGETPDGVRYVSMAKGLVKPSGAYRRTPRRYAVALGWEERHADQFVYSDDIAAGSPATQLGSSCRICPRPDCNQRAFPPAAARIELDLDARGVIPYEIK